MVAIGFAKKGLDLYGRMSQEALWKIYGFAKTWNLGWGCTAFLVLLLVCHGVSLSGAKD